jgi:cytochrome c biogenesis protein ResB
MGVGLFVAFYMVHTRLWIVAVPDARGKLVLWIGGQANKNKDRFEQKFEEVVESIREELDRASIAPRSARKEEEAELTLVAVK